MKLALCFATAVAAYLLGCVNGAILTSRIFFHDDIRRYGSGNAGLTNFYRSFGAKYAICVIAADMLKAVAAVLIGKFVFSALFEQPLLGKYFAAIFCVIGHIFPAFYGFRGGKGILCSGTLLLCLDWRITLVGWGLFLLLWLTTRYVSLGSVSAAVSFPVSTYFVYGGNATLTFFALATALLVIWAHRENISRLLRGEERKFHFHLEPPKED